jgi:DNA-binding XRE family transcriptional regulator
VAKSKPYVYLDIFPFSHHRSYTFNNDMFDLLTILRPPPEAHEASDGTFWRSAGTALLHDLVERKWAELLPSLQSGQVVSQTRRELRLSQAELAHEAGISQPLLSMVESGQRSMTEAVVLAVWGALWRLYHSKTPSAIEMLVRLEQDTDGGLVGVATLRERIEAL